jgi:hypothetical protein
VFSLQAKEMGTISKAAITHSNMLKLGSTKNEVHPSLATHPQGDSPSLTTYLEFIIVIINNNNIIITN